MGFGGRTLAKTVFIFFVIVFFISVYQYITSKERALEKNLAEMTEAGAALTSDQVADYLDKYISRLNALSETDTIRKVMSGDAGTMKEAQDLINISAAEGDVYLGNVLILNSHKDIVISVAKPYEDIVASLDTYLYRAAMGTVVTDSQFNSQPNISERYFAIIVPVFEDRKLIGYIISRISTDVFAEVTDKTLINENYGFWLYDGSGVVLASEGPEEMKDEFKAYNLSKEIPTTGKYFVVEKDISSTLFRTDWHVIFALPKNEALSTYFIIKLAFLFICAAILISELIRTLMRYKSIVLPMRSIIFDLKKINKSGEYTMPVSPTGYENFDAIGEALNDMIKGIIDGDYAIDALIEKYRDLFNDKRLVLLEWDFETLNMRVSSNYKDVFGIEFTPFGEMDFSPDKLNIHPDDAGRFVDWIRDVRMGRKTSPIIYRKKFADGKYKYLEFSFYIKNDDMGNPSSGLGCIMDVDRFARKEIALKRAADRDKYTGAYNKYTYLEILPKKLEEAKTQDEECFVSILKLHNFYALEDTSIGLGEEALRFITNVLRDNLDCTVGRILSDALGIVGNAENLEFILDEVNKELDMGLLNPADKKVYRVYTNMAVILVEDKNADVNDFVSLCVKEYEAFEEKNGNNFYIKRN